MEEDGGQGSLADKASWHLTGSPVHANPSQDAGVLGGGLRDHRILLYPFQGPSELFWTSAPLSVS